MANDIDRVILGRNEYERLLRRVEELRSAAEKTTTAPSKTPGSGGGASVDDAWNRLADCTSQVEFQLKAYMLEAFSLEEELECIRNQNIKTAMKLRYIDGLSVERIADTMRYSPRNIRRFLNRGREVYERYYGE